MDTTPQLPDDRPGAPTVVGARRVAALVAASLLLVACGNRVPTIDVQAERLNATEGSPSPSPSPTDDLSPSPSPSPTDEATPAERDPTDTDRARFVASYDPGDATGLEHVAFDVDGDGTAELVFAWVHRSERIRVSVAWWSGSEYEIGHQVDGGAGTAVDRLWVRDITADGQIEIITQQSGSAGAASASVWQVQGARSIIPLNAVGGCHDGSNTYGVVGVDIVDRDRDGQYEIEATCDDSPLPRNLWSTDRYVWADGAFRHQPTS